MTIRVLLAACVGFLTPIGTASAQTCDPVEAAKLLAPDGSTQEYFGSSVSIDGDTALVGVYGDGDNGPGAGAVHVFRRYGVDWLGESKLLPADGAEGDLFGAAVALSGDTAVVGALGDGDNGFFAGSAYIFRYNGRDSTWVEEAKLLPSDGAEGDLFGCAVSISGNTAIIGASGDSDNGSGSGSAYVFRFDGDNWIEEAKLLPSEGGPGDAFGASVAISLDTTVIGTWGDDENGDDAGAVYVFHYEEPDWFGSATLRPSDGAAGDYFGGAVALSLDTTIYGADGDDDNGVDSGSAYVYHWNGTEFIEGDKLFATDAEQQAHFGYSVAISGDTAIVGAWSADANGSDSGSAYVFEPHDSGWEAIEFHPFDGASGDGFGRAVAVSCDTAIIGADGDDDNGDSSGSAYVFDLSCDDCPADINGDGEVNTLDFLALLNLWVAGDPIADWNGDGDVNTLDFLAYLNDWVAGC